MNTEELKQFEGEEAAPVAGHTIEGYRSIGYSLQTAVADIIDNSIAAQAENVWIDYDWDGERTVLTITDDGYGMSLEELISAMRPASKNPLMDRDPADLGRFGMGLKTASFSQCRILTVAAKRMGTELNYRAWNMDYVHKAGWRLLKYLDDEKHLDRLKKMPRGTTVIWQDIDNLVKGTEKGNEENLKVFLNQIDEMERHLAMVFHLIIEEKKLTIRARDRKITAWDPYIKSRARTGPGQELRNGITVQPYILPHKSELSKEEFENGSWIKGWNAHQGFYIYRNKRMIIAGEWLGMYKQEEHSKLSRIMVNIPNTSELDREWQLDIKKAVIQLPHDIRRELKRIADESRKEAVEIYRQTGKIKRKKFDKEDIQVWAQHTRNGKRCYQINKEHSVIKAFIDQHGQNKSVLNRVFRLIEETLPLAMIVINESEHQDNQHAPYEGKSISDLVPMVVQLYDILRAKGYTIEDAIAEIQRTEPFNYYPELTENINDARN